MTSLTALRNAAKSAEGESPTPSDIRIEELKEAFIEDELTEIEFDELLDAAIRGGPPYRASVIVNDRKTQEVPPPPDRDIHVVQNRNKYFNIDGNIARIREPPDWENVINVTGNRRGPDEDEVERISRDAEPKSKDVQEKQDEIRKRIIGRADRRRLF